MADPVSTHLLARYLSGEATDAERAEVEAWARVEANGRELERLKAIWHPAPDPQWNVEDAWQRVSARLDAPAEVAAVFPRRGLGWDVALAAAVVLALGAGAVWRAMRVTAPPATVVVATTVGERRTVDLADGSQVILAPGSQLTIPVGYGDATRRVDLRGEAWFTVIHDADRPFLVHAAGTITEDLGTEFLVQELPGGAGVRVALVSGSASLRSEHGPAAAVTLFPNDIGTLDAGAPAVQVERGASLDALVAWPAGRLEFEDAPLGDVAAALARWYGMPVVLADSALASRRFTGTLRLDSLDDALEVLRLSLGVQVARQADTLVVR